jgi:hypothetical protein
VFTMCDVREGAMYAFPIALPLPVVGTLLTVASCLAACGDGQGSRDQRPPNSPLAIASDSSGVRIVEFPAILSDLPIVFQIDTVVQLDLGGSRGDPAAELDPRGGEQDARQLRDGSYVVQDRYSLKVFDAAGRYQFSAGGEGDGPGEFRYIYGLCVLPGDTILGIEDQRAVLFDSRGQHARTFSIASIGSGHLSRGGCFPDGSLLAVIDSHPDPADSAYRRATGQVISSAGESLSTVGLLEDGFASTVIPVMPTAALWGDYVHAGDGRRPEVSVYHRARGLTRIIRWLDAGMAVDADLIATVTRLTNPTATEERVQEMVARHLSRQQPSTAPRYQQIKVDETGRMWVLDYPNLLAMTEWRPIYTVFDPEGYPIGRVPLPQLPGARALPFLASAKADQVWLRWIDDDLGFRHLTLHNLRPMR